MLSDGQYLLVAIESQLSLSTSRCLSLLQWIEKVSLSQKVVGWATDLDQVVHFSRNWA